MAGDYINQLELRPVSYMAHAIKTARKAGEHKIADYLENIRNAALYVEHEFNGYARDFVQHDEQCRSGGQRFDFEGLRTGKGNYYWFPEFEKRANDFAHDTSQRALEEFEVHSDQLAIKASNLVTEMRSLIERSNGV